MKKLLLATAVSALSVSAFASHSYFANKNVYVTANAGLGFPVKTTHGIYNGKQPYQNKNEWSHFIM